VTPSFPAGHALQSHLIALCLEAANRLPNQPEIAANRPPNQPDMLKNLARRIAQNRVIAGLHYPLDNEAGEVAAEKCFELLMEGSEFKKLLHAAREEGAQVAKVPVVQET
jgi:hypothetical protein